MKETNKDTNKKTQIFSYYLSCKSLQEFHDVSPELLSGGNQ